jgi:hypothetical protein
LRGQPLSLSLDSLGGSPKQLTILLRQRGAPASAHLIGGPSSLDGSELPLAEAVDHAFNDQGGVVVSCVPGRLALYFQEFPPGDVFILATRAA